MLCFSHSYVDALKPCETPLRSYTYAPCRVAVDPYVVHLLGRSVLEKPEVGVFLCE